MLEDLIAAEKITKEQSEIFYLFEVSDLGRMWFKRMIMETFLEQPPPQDIRGTTISFIDGRRSLLREIYGELEFIKNKIREYENEHGAARTE